MTTFLGSDTSQTDQKQSDHENVNRLTQKVCQMHQVIQELPTLLDDLINLEVGLLAVSNPDVQAIQQVVRAAVGLTRARQHAGFGDSKLLTTKERELDQAVARLIDVTRHL